VHMYWMRYPLDVVFISDRGRVVAVYRALAPWHRTRIHGSALHVLELPAGTIAATGTAVGDELTWAASNGGPPGAEGNGSSREAEHGHA
jgi:uncharacterized protein